MKRPVKQRVINARVHAKATRQRPGSCSARYLFILLTALVLMLSMQLARASFPRSSVNPVQTNSTASSAGALMRHLREVGIQAFERGRHAYAAETLRPLAYAGDTESQYYLAVMYDNGVGVEKDPAMAAHWYHKAALLGHSDAQYNLGIAYSRGEGIAQDMPKALHWWREAGKQGNKNALFNLGVAYSTGRGTQRDISLAIHWWTRAAKLGDSIAQYNLGAVYANGVGVHKDLHMAARWWQRSAAQGNDQAKAALIILKNYLH